MPRATLTLLLLLAAMPVSAQLQGTLFTSPEQREYLDFLRQEHLARNRERGFDINEVVTPEFSEQVEDTGPPPEPVIYRLGGIMSRSDGSYSIWLNGRSLDEDALPGGARVLRENGTLALRFPTPQGVVYLRPGQSLNFDDGEIMENYRASDTQATKTEPMGESGIRTIPTELSVTPPGAGNVEAPEPSSTTEESPTIDRTSENVLTQLQGLVLELDIDPEERQALLLEIQATAEGIAEENNDAQD